MRARLDLKLCSGPAVSQQAQPLRSGAPCGHTARKAVPLATASLCCPATKGRGEVTIQMAAPQGDSTVESLLLQLWHQRDSEEGVGACCEKLIEAAAQEIDQVELYLPQFAHIVITLPAEVANTEAIEKFILSVCQISVHIVSEMMARAL